MNFYVIRNDETDDKLLTINELKKELGDDYKNRVLVVDKDIMKWSQVPESKRNKFEDNIKKIYPPTNKVEHNTIGQIVLVDFYDKTTAQNFKNVDEKPDKNIYEQVCELENIKPDSKVMSYLNDVDKYKGSLIKMYENVISKYGKDYLKEVIDDKFSKTYSFYVEGQDKKSQLAPLTLENLKDASNKYNDLSYETPNLMEDGYWRGSTVDTITIVNNKTNERTILNVNKDLGNNFDKKKELTEVLKDGINKFSPETKSFEDWYKNKATLEADRDIKNLFGHEKDTFIENIANKVHSIFNK